ncbi:MAG: hypothetical protein H9864_06895, partial [Candidatus Faecalibacterium intestinavium]|nr:hypothetical protein [Candidatus Faecalibacterium intestinavium]
GCGAAGRQRRQQRSRQQQRNQFFHGRILPLFEILAKSFALRVLFYYNSKGIAVAWATDLE